MRLICTKQTTCKTSCCFFPQISAQKYLDLLSGDQCSREMSQGRIFHGLAEGPITFMPTYKFEKGRESNKMQPFYDQGEKKRVPAWTDRILFRGSGPQRSALQANAAEQPADIGVSCVWFVLSTKCEAYVCAVFAATCHTYDSGV